jgi:hypothetical protein
MNPDFRDILSAFTEEKVEFMVVGAFAMAYLARLVTLTSGYLLRPAMRSG